MTLDLLFDYWGILLDGPRADGKFIVLNWDFTDTGEQYVLTLENSALTYSGPDRQSSEADATLRLARTTLDEINLGNLTLRDAVAAGLVQITGNPAKLVELLSLLERFDVDFNIVTP
jgi:alkyl sulfatase BDS1-like metallo-beta-lactamase superfamily hydrolase